MARKRANLTDLLNDLTFKTIYNKNRLLACSAHEWDGLPDENEEKYLEGFLFDHGMCAIYKDPVKGFMIVQAQDAGKYNWQGKPLRYNLTWFGGHKQVDADDVVIIENNPMRLPTFDFVMLYVNRLTEIERTADVNVKAVKTPYIITCDDKDVLTFKQIFKQVDGNVPAMFVDKRLNVEAINVLKTDAKFLCKELKDYENAVNGDLLTFLGFNNVPIDKKERVNVEEATSNNQLIMSYAQLQLASRELACQRAKEKWGLPMSVKRREGVCTNVQSAVQQQQGDGGAA